MKFSSLPTHVRQFSMDLAKEWRNTDAVQRGKYYAQNGFASPVEYIDHIKALPITGAEIKEAVIEVAIKLTIRSGTQEWAQEIPQLDYMVRQRIENEMLSKAERRTRVQ